MSIITRKFLENQLLKKKRAYPEAFTGVQFMDYALQKAKCPDVNNLFKSVYTTCKCSKFHFFIFQLVLVVSCVHHQKKKDIFARLSLARDFSLKCFCVSPKLLDFQQGQLFSERCTWWRVEQSQQRRLVYLISIFLLAKRPAYNLYFITRYARIRPRSL